MDSFRENQVQVAQASTFRELRVFTPEKIHPKKPGPKRDFFSEKKWFFSPPPS